MDEPIKQPAPVSTLPEETKVIQPEVKPEPPVDAGLEEDRAKADPSLDGPYLQSPLFYQVASLFNVDARDFSEVAPKLSVIVDYVVKDLGIKDTGDVLLKIREIERGVLPPQWGEKPYANIYEFIRLASQKSSIEKAMKAFERNPNG